MFGDVLFVFDEFVTHRLSHIIGAGPAQRNPVDDVPDQMKAVQIVHHHHVERRARRAFFLVAPYM